MNEIFIKYNYLSLTEFLAHNSVNEDYKENREIATYYERFLKNTDYIANKIIEAQVLNLSCDDYKDVLLARQYARDQINLYRE